MFRTSKPTNSGLKGKKGQSYIGETIEQKVRRITTNKEPIKDGAPLIYTDRSEGVQPDYNIRTDRFEHAVEAMDKVTKAKIAKREAKMGEKAKEGMDKESKTEKEITKSDSKEGGKPSSTQGTDSQ